jgi:predicted nucleic acid-binding protein
VITALDTNVLLDVLIPEARLADASQRRLDAALHEGGLVVCEIVYAELAVHFPSQAALDAFLADTRIRLDASHPEALAHAAAAWGRYAKRRSKDVQCPRCGQQQAVTCPACGTHLTPRQHILSDFLIGGHALVQADRLLTRDRGYYQAFFAGLNVIVP